MSKQIAESGVSQITDSLRSALNRNGLTYKGDFTHEPNDTCHYFEVLVEDDAAFSKAARERLGQQLSILVPRLIKEYTTRDFYLNVQHDVQRHVIVAKIKVS